MKKILGIFFISGILSYKIIYDFFTYKLLKELDRRLKRNTWEYYE